jgi:two-component system sensor histidine kinase KdpD
MADPRTAFERRPRPAAQLAEAPLEAKGYVGHLKIFIGAAPGVGKTYKMLEAGRAKLKAGVAIHTSGDFGVSAQGA